MDANRPNDRTGFRNHARWLNGGGMTQHDSLLLAWLLKQRVFRTLSPRATGVFAEGCLANRM